MGSYGIHVLIDHLGGQRHGHVLKLHLELGIFRRGQSTLDMVRAEAVNFAEGRGKSDPAGQLEHRLGNRNAQFSCLETFNVGFSQTRLLAYFADLPTTRSGRSIAGAKKTV